MRYAHNVQLELCRRLWPTTSHHHQRLPAAQLYFFSFFFLVVVVVVSLRIHWLAVPSVFSIFILFWLAPYLTHTSRSTWIYFCFFFFPYPFETCHYPNSVIPIAIKKGAKIIINSSRLGREIPIRDGGRIPAALYIKCRRTDVTHGVGIMKQEHGGDNFYWVFSLSVCCCWPGREEFFVWFRIEIIGRHGALLLRIGRHHLCACRESYVSY